MMQPALHARETQPHRNTAAGTAPRSLSPVTAPQVTAPKLTAPQAITRLAPTHSPAIRLAPSAVVTPPRGDPTPVRLPCVLTIYCCPRWRIGGGRSIIAYFRAGPAQEQDKSSHRELLPNPARFRYYLSLKHRDHGLIRVPTRHRSCCRMPCESSLITL